MDNRQIRRTIWQAVVRHRQALLGIMFLLWIVEYGPVFLLDELTLHLSNGPVVSLVMRLVSTAAAVILGSAAMLGRYIVANRMLDADRVALIDLWDGRQALWKSVGLRLLTVLKLTAWMLPGVALMIIGGLIGTGVGTAPQWTLYLWMVPGFALLLALIIPASYRYGLAMCILADDPHADRTAGACIDLSKDLMKGRCRQAFCLLLPLAAAAAVTEFLLPKLFPVFAVLPQLLMIIVQPALVIAWIGFYQAMKNHTKAPLPEKAEDKKETKP